MKLEKEIEIIKSYLKKNNNALIEFEIKNINNEEYKKISNMHFKKIKLTLELEEPILDEVERKYLSGVIMPFRDRITDIIKYKSYDFENKEYIVIHCNQSETTMFPYFDKGTMYKGMELNKEYSLKELGL